MRSNRHHTDTIFELEIFVNVVVKRLQVTVHIVTGRQLLVREFYKLYDFEVKLEVCETHYTTQITNLLLIHCNFGCQRPVTVCIIDVNLIMTKIVKLL